MLLCTLLPLCLLGLPQEPAPLDLRRLVPADAYLAISTAPWKEIRARSAESAWRHFFADDAWFDLRDWAGLALEEGFHEGITFEALEMAASVDGGATFFVYPVEQDVGVGFLLDGGGSAAFPGYARRVLAALGGGEQLLPHASGGAEVCLIRCEVGAGVSQVDCAFLAGGVLGVFSAPHRDAAIERASAVLAELAGPTESRGLLGVETYLTASARPADAPEPAISAFLSLGAMMDRVLADEDIDADDERMIAILGLSELEWIYAEGDIGAGEQLDLRMRMQVPTGTLLGDLLEFFGPAPHEFLPLLPAQSIGVGLGNFDVASAFEHVRGFLGEWYPEALDKLDEDVESTALEFGIDLHEDVIDQLTGRFADFNLLLPEGEIIDPMGLTAGSSALNQGAGLLIEIRRPAEFEATLSTALGLVGMEDLVETEEVHGVTVNHLPLGLLGAHWAFLDGKLVASFYPTPIRAVVERSASVETPAANAGLAFGLAVARNPDASMISLAETRTAVEAMLGALSVLSQVASIGLLEAGAGGLPAALRELPAVEWPDSELASDYFRGTFGSALTRRAGVLELHFSGR